MFRILAVIALMFLVPLAPIASAQTITRADPVIPMTPEIAQAREQFLAGEYDAAMRVIEPAALAGDVTAQNLLGVAYGQGRGQPYDVEQSVAWFTRAAESGDPRAMLNLVRVLRSGEGPVAADPVAARQWAQRAVNQGFEGAFPYLGRMLEQGVGGPADLATAVVLYERAQARGDPYGATYLGYLYRDATGVPRDLGRARTLFETGAQAGLVEAQVAYAFLLEHGQGGPVDMAGAQRWYRAAIDRGSASAAYHMAMMIERLSPPGTSLGDAATLCAAALEQARPTEIERWRGDCAEIRAAAGLK